MSMLLAFRVAQPVTDLDPSPPPDYDAELQALTWDDEFAPPMASGVCTRRQKGYLNCSSNGGTSCQLSGSGCFDPFFAYCLVCDY
jgi:hypothetical protein